MDIFKKTQGYSYTECNILLDELMRTVKNTQMQREEYAYIASFLKNNNFLVFGTGHDSNYWRCVNKRGKTIFLEDDDDWIDSNSDILKIEYTSKRSEYEKLLEEFLGGNYKNISVPLPSVIKNIKWDVIFVDAPVGNSDQAPGRMQSIYSAYRLASKDTKIFVHDCDRTVEDVYTSTMFDTVKDLVKLRHVKLKDETSDDNL